MPRKNCKYKTSKERYGHFPLMNRFVMDQVPIELNRRHFTLETRGTTDPIHIRGPKKDLDKRQATLQLCVRVKGKQIVRREKSYPMNRSRGSAQSALHVRKLKKLFKAIGIACTRKASYLNSTFSEGEVENRPSVEDLNVQKASPISKGQDETNYTEKECICPAKAKL